MSKRAGKWLRIFIEGYNLTTLLNALQPGGGYAKQEVGGFTEDMNYLLGRGDGTITIDGFFSDTSNETHDALKALSSGNTTHIVSAAFGNNALPTLGDPTLHLNATQAMYDVNPDLNGVVGVHAEYAAKGTPVEHGILLGDETVTADGDASSYDGGAQTTNGGVGYLHILGLSSGDTIVVTIEDSSDDAVFGTLLTFTIDGSAIDAERVTVSGTVERYIRASYNVTGTGVSFPLAVAFVRN